jgi:hypothetical protein
MRQLDRCLQLGPLVCVCAMTFTACSPEVRGPGDESSRSVGSSGETTSAGQGGATSGHGSSSAGSGGEAGAGGGGLAGPLLAPCLEGSGTVAFYHGTEQDPVHPGAETLAIDGWKLRHAEPDYVWIDRLPEDASTDPHGWCFFIFSLTALGQPLAPGFYPNAMRAQFEDPGHPGLTVAYHNQGRDDVKGWFEIHAVDLPNTVLATFQQQCDGMGLLRGCVRYEAE